MKNFDSGTTDQPQWSLKGLSVKKVRGSVLFAIGWLLSPLCWWNDLIVNLPVATGASYLCHLISPDWTVGGAIAGYWLSNIVGILLMQLGAIDVLQAERNWKKDLFWGVVSSSVFTIAIVAVVQLHWIDLPFDQLFAVGEP